ncbi:uncharacterized protein LOC134221453 [Armigeres subalbatus]|uniref:uncharacterized protein LOC134221453 n=1 Tax=Armigeres subalbatus TaxID=124917 RepID=UPI002ED03058
MCCRWHRIQSTHFIPRICNLCTKDDPLEATLKKFWEIEDISEGPALSVEQDRCEKHYVATTTRDPFGRYIVSLPRTDNPDFVLGSSRDIADRRLMSVERRLEHDSAPKDAYHRFMDEYFQLGHMKKLDDPVDDDQTHCYVPHHAVFKESSTSTKEDLLSIVLRFRTCCVAIVADVEKMYRQMLHSPEDRKFLRIRFRTNSNDPIFTYELQTVTYGTASVPYLATRTVQQIARDNGNQFPAAVDPVIYDFLSGADDVDLQLK